MIELRFVFNTIEEAQAFLASRNAPAQVTTTAEEDALAADVDQDKPKRGRPRKETVPVVAPAAAEGDAITIDAARDALQRYASKHGFTEASALIARFGVSRVGELSPADYGRLIEAANGDPSPAADGE